jgi:hypothetical protein
MLLCFPCNHKLHRCAPATRCETGQVRRACKARQSTSHFSITSSCSCGMKGLMHSTHSIAWSASGKGPCTAQLCCSARADSNRHRLTIRIVDQPAKIVCNGVLCAHASRNMFRAQDFYCCRVAATRYRKLTSNAAPACFDCLHATISPTIQRLNRRAWTVAPRAAAWSGLLGSI